MGWGLEFASEIRAGRGCQTPGTAERGKRWAHCPALAVRAPPPAAASCHGAASARTTQGPLDMFPREGARHPRWDRWNCWAVCTGTHKP